MGRVSTIITWNQVVSPSWRTPSKRLRNCSHSAELTSTAFWIFRNSVRSPSAEVAGSPLLNWRNSSVASRTLNIDFSCGARRNIKQYVPSQPALSDLVCSVCIPTFHARKTPTQLGRGRGFKSAIFASDPSLCLRTLSACSSKAQCG